MADLWNGMRAIGGGWENWTSYFEIAPAPGSRNYVKWLRCNQGKYVQEGTMRLVDGAFGRSRSLRIFEIDGQYVLGGIYDQGNQWAYWAADPDTNERLAHYETNRDYIRDAISRGENLVGLNCLIDPIE